MRKLLIPVLFLFFVSFKPLDTSILTRSSYNLKGDVKRVKEVCFETVIESDSIVKGTRADGFDLSILSEGISLNSMMLPVGDFDLFFDKKGHVCQGKFYQDSSSYLSYWVRPVNPEDELKILLLGSKTHTVWYFDYKFDKKNKISKAILGGVSLGFLSMHYNYLDGGRLKRIETFYGDSIHMGTTTFNYGDQPGNYSVRVVFFDDKQEEQKHYRLMIETDANDRVERVKKYNKNGYLVEYVCFMHDAFGNITKYQHFNDNDELKNEYNYSYTFDTHNNWIRKVEYSENEPKHVVERAIEYY